MSELPLSEQFQNALKEVTNITNSNLRKDSPEFSVKLKQVIHQLDNVKASILRLALFSINETIEEIATKHIKYLSIDYHIALCLELNMDRKSRAKTLMSSQKFYLQFLHSLDNYEILDKSQSQLLEHFKDPYNPTLEELRPNDPTQRREYKIENFKLEKTLNERLKIIDQVDNLDDEVVRQLYIDQLKLFALKSFQSYEGNMLELEVLKNIPEPKIEEEDHQEEVLPFEYTDKLETLEPPLVSKQGRVLRPFTIVSDRNQVRSKVCGTGQVLPSMTVEELVEQELQNGGMVKPQEPQNNDEEDRDTDNYHDQETYKARQWDEFKEANPKGSGNTTNRG
ncbi:BA75_00954T0 [Komagataella pastoris]|uniref:BA75_00954T0 n=1 Tax=Komagataella pastoris TaxID=4922 RepID=A0A1B2J7L4_PICPA|nr:BA75_00954T0 [Komagataella pastoris]